jgi:transglutaminase-like putative cysteine protease
MILFREFLAPRALVKLALLLLAMSAFASGIGESVTDMNSGMFFPVAAYAVILSWTLAFSKLPARRAWSFTLISGLIFSFVHVAQLWESLGFLIRDIYYLQVGLIDWVFDKIPPDFHPIQITLNELSSKSMQLLGKISFALRSRLLDNPRPRELSWDIPVLILSAWAGWTLKRRKNALAALAPIIALQAYITYFSGNRTFPIQVSIFILLILMGMNEWEGKLESQPGHEGLKKASPDVNMTIVIFSLGIVLAAGWLPSVSVEKLIDQLTEIERRAGNRRVADALGLEESSNPSNTYVTPGLPREHLVGADPATSQNVVFTVQTGELPRMPDNEFDEMVPSYYWRSITYDIYSGRGWETTLTESLDYSAGQLLLDTTPQGYRLVTLDVKKIPNVDERLYWTGTLVSVDQPFQLGWRALPDSLPESIDPLTGADVLGGVAGFDEYQVRSLLPVATIEQMRASDQNYPEIIRERYLALPGTVPVRVRRLARELAENSANPYDQATALEAYLRTYPYTLDVPPPPQDRDIADYFLFELLTGYCDYYASSMVVMARSIGLPARLVTGYASGGYIPSAAEYVVRLKDAHSWVEIYFNGIGWVEFEPTASQPQILRPSETEETIATPIPVQTVEDRRGFSLQSISGLLLVVSLALAVGVGTVLFFVWRRSKSRIDIQQIYMRVFQQGNKLVPIMKIHETPLMFAERLGDRLRASPRQGFTGRLLLPASLELEFLTDLYIRVMYGTHTTTNEEDLRVRTVWQKLYWRLLLARAMGKK